MTGPWAGPAGAVAGSGADERAVPALAPGGTGRALDPGLCSGTRGRPAAGERARETEWAAFFRAEWPLLVRFLRVSFGEASASDAADAAQIAFIELLRRWEQVRSPRAWVRTVACRHMMRQRDRDEALLGRLSDTARPLPWLAPVSGPMDISDEQQAVLAALRQLPPAQRHVIALVYDGYSSREAAEMLGTTEAAVRQSLKRGRKKLRDMLYASGPALGHVP
jgi:RNA polymerase sigma factor (sigma-70 family)